MNKSKNAAFGGVLTALSLVFLYLSSFTSQIAFCAAAGVIISMFLIKRNVKSAIILYLAVSFLSVILLPSKSVALVYTGFFGIYSILKYFFEGIKSTSVQWFVKILYFNLSMTILFIIYIKLLMTGAQFTIQTIAFLIMVINVAFILYDIVFSKLIAFFQVKFRL